jgi:hypothetical protein
LLSLGLYYKTFYSVNCCRPRVFVTVIHFHPSLLFASKARAYQNGAPHNGRLWTCLQILKECESDLQ